MSAGLGASVAFLFPGLRSGWGFILCSDCREFGSVMAIIFIEIEEELYFILGLVRGGAKSVGTAEFALESGYYGLGV